MDPAVRMRVSVAGQRMASDLYLCAPRVGKSPRPSEERSVQCHQTAASLRCPVVAPN